MEDNNLRSYLATHLVDYVEYKHAAVHTVAESDSDPEIKKIPGLRGKTLFLRDEAGKFYLVGMPVHKRLNFKNLEKELHVKKLTMATSEELFEKIKLVPGSVSIFGAINNEEVTLVLDSEIWTAQEVGFHPNLNTSTIVLKHESLERFYNSLKNNKRII